MASSSSSINSSSDSTITAIKNALTATSRRIQLPMHAYPLDPLTGYGEARQDLLNLFAEPQPADARSRVILRSTPGAAPNLPLPGGPIRAMQDLHGFLYVIAGTITYRLVVGQVPTPLGGVLDNANSTIAIGPNQVVVCTPPKIYVANHDGSLAEITTAPFPAASSVTFLDGYFVFTEQDTGKFWNSQLTGAGDFDAFSFASVEAMPDVIVRGIAHNGVLWLFGHDAVEIWQDVGATPVPFQRISGGVIYIGTISPASISHNDTSLCWLGRDGVVYQTNGLTSQRISTFAMEQQIASYGDFQNARGCSYTQEGHKFYALTFPTPGKTWVYDAATSLWHRRSSSVDGSGRWRANAAAMFGQVPVIGDYATGLLYELQPNLDTDAGASVLREAVFPLLSYEGYRVFMHRLELEMETGTALSPNSMLLDWSDDGVNYKAPRSLSARFATGQFGRRVYTTRLGSFRQRTLRLRMRNYATIYAADADFTRGDA